MVDSKLTFIALEKVYVSEEMLDICVWVSDLLSMQRPLFIALRIPLNETAVSRGLFAFVFDVRPRPSANAMAIPTYPIPVSPLCPLRFLLLAAWLSRKSSWGCSLVRPGGASLPAMAARGCCNRTTPSYQYLRLSLSKIHFHSNNSTIIIIILFF